MIQEITTRRSIRKYKAQEVEEEKILDLLESARLAPSGSNTQPWTYIVVRDQETRERLAKASHDQKWMCSAPVFIACVCDVHARVEQEQEVFADETCDLVELKQCIRDISISIEHMALEAAHIGLGTCYVAWFVQEDVRPILHIPEDKYVVAILTVGYPDENPEKRPRKSLEEIVRYEHW